MNAIEVLKKLPSSKEEIKVFAENVVDSLMDDGFVEPLELSIRVEAILRIMKAIKEDDRYKTATFDHADNFPEKTFSFSGVDVTKSSSVRYDYSEDAEWQRLKADENMAATERKNREAILKSIKDSHVIDGVECFPPVRLASDVLRYKF